MMSLYKENETIITTGIYEKGSSPEIDQVIQKHSEIEDFLKQEETEKCDMKETLDRLSALTEIEIPEEEYGEQPALDRLGPGEISNQEQKIE